MEIKNHRFEISDILVHWQIYTEKYLNWFPQKKFGIVRELFRKLFFIEKIVFVWESVGKIIFHGKDLNWINRGKKEKRQNRKKEIKNHRFEISGSLVHWQIFTGKYLNSVSWRKFGFVWELTWKLFFMEKVWFGRKYFSFQIFT